MTEYNNISKLIKELFIRTKNTIFSNLMGFFILNLTLIILLTIYITSNQWIINHLQIYHFQSSMIILRFSIFCFWLGINIGWVKILFNYIDNKKMNIVHIFQCFHLLPFILSFVILLYLIWLIPISYIMYKFPYDINMYGTNISLYLQELQAELFSMLDNDISKNLFSAYFNEFDMLIISGLGIIYYTFLIKFWTTILFIIDNQLGINVSLHLSYKIHQKVFPILILTIISIVMLGMVALSQNLIILCLIFLILQIVWLHYFRILKK